MNWVASCGKRPFLLQRQVLINGFTRESQL